jgi:prepilin-type N-terminal cleavage/methylation domain-containing protein
METRIQGFTLAELVVCLAILTILLMTSLPSLVHCASSLRLRLAAAELVSTLRGARSLAIRLGTNVAVKFQPGPNGYATWAVYRDGDGDGVLSRDITAGIDPLVVPPRPLELLGRRMRFGFPSGKPARDPGDPSLRLRPTDDPIRFNGSDLASFGPLGTSTPGSLYLTDSASGLVAVRVFGRTGKVKVLVYDFDQEVWR